MSKVFDDAQLMIKNIIDENMPGTAVENALKAHDFKGNIYLVAIGKAAWTMAKAAQEYLGDKLVKGIVVTKYEHSMGDLPKCDIYEAGHPVADENTIAATYECIKLAESLTENDELLFLVSGGGSALFERPLEGITLDDIQDITNQLLASGADIVEMNMIRKRLSSVKAGRFAQLASPAKVFAIILSDVLGDRLDTIASGPAVPDASTIEDAMKVAAKYNLKLTDLQNKYLTSETPKAIDNVKTVITGSVRTLCESAAETAKKLGYTPFVLTTTMNCEASEAGRLFATIAADTKAGRNSFATPCAIIAGGETVVTLKGKGKGGRNQEKMLAAAKGIAGLENALIFSLGSDGTDGPTDAAGGIVDGQTAAKLKEAGIDIDGVLANNDSYNALKAVDGLIITGPTGTNVNDVVVILCL
ncbi:MAG: glycerate kinase [Defluviitaleaceae bacterium]|nr:glycerate kinase [Defluviitaleaceae bacterium]